MSNKLKWLQLYFKVFSYFQPKRSANQARRLMLTPRPSKDEILWVNPDEKVTLSEVTCISVWHRGNKRVLLIHGWSGGVHHFNRILVSLLAKNYTVIAVHPSGHATPNCHQKTANSHPGMFIQSIKDVYTLYRSDIDYAIGHSMGAAALMLCASQNPNIRKVIIIASPASFTSVLERFSKGLMLSENAKQAFFDEVERFIGIPHQALVVHEEVKGTSTPCLIIHDEQDREVPFSDANLLSVALTKASRLNTQGLGHRRLLNAEVVINEIHQFLD